MFPPPPTVDMKPLDDAHDRAAGKRGPICGQTLACTILNCFHVSVRVQMKSRVRAYHILIEGQSAIATASQNLLLMLLARCTNLGLRMHFRDLAQFGIVTVASKYARGVLVPLHKPLFPASLWPIQILLIGVPQCANLLFLPRCA